ncbi:DUF614 domain-containing protein [Podospora conica]|nr:DUF614 domain-containing protein [Schizothecium conicum]
MSAPTGAPAAAPSEHLSSNAPEPSSRGWMTSFFGCFSPFSTCLVTCCVPCVTYGKTRHRLRNNGDLAGYSCCNSGCLLLCAAGVVCLSAIPVCMQRGDIRAKYNIRGNCCFDITMACCCPCCDIIRQDKEVAERSAGVGGAVKEQYQATGGMTYPPEKQ